MLSYVQLVSPDGGEKQLVHEGLAGARGRLPGLRGMVVRKTQGAKSCEHLSYRLGGMPNM